MIFLAISQVIKYGGSPDDLVWKFPGEEINATSQLIVDEPFEALLCVSGQAADLFGPGRHSLTVPNIPIVKKIINIPTGGESPFPCKVFYINKVHQMDMLWGTRGAITLDDPKYDIFLHIMLHGSLTFSIVESRKFLVKLVGFRSRYSSEEMLNNFKGLISSHVKDAISTIMIKGGNSFFEINADLFKTSETVKERLDEVFDEYGVRVEYFNIESIEVPPEDYNAISAAKSRRTSRLIEGYTWQEERQMDIAEKFAGNEGTMGAVGGAVSGFMVGGALGGTVANVARGAFNSQGQAAPGVRDMTGVQSSSNLVRQQQQYNAQPVQQPMQPVQQAPAPAPAPAAGGGFCPECGNPVTAGSKFCNICGTKLQAPPPVCPGCGAQLAEGSRFCNICGTKVN